MKSPEGKSTIPHKKEHQDHKTGTEQAEDHDHKSSTGQTSGPHKQRRISQYSKDAPNQGHSQTYAHQSHGHGHTHGQGHGHAHGHGQGHGHAQSHGHGHSQGHGHAQSHGHSHGHGHGHSHGHAHGHHHHHHHHTEHGERPGRRISHHSHTTDGGHAKDGAHKGGHGHHGRARAGSKKEHDRHSVATSGDLNPLVEYENTYKLEPDGVFLPGKVKTIIKEVLEENLKGQNYAANLMASRCMALSDIIKERIRQLEMPRFKTVVLVLVGENKEQALSVASLCLWNKDTDNFASCEYSKGNLHVVAMVFGVYQE